MTPPWGHSFGTPGQRKYVGVDSSLLVGKLEWGEVTFTKSQCHLLLTQEGNPHVRSPISLTCPMGTALAQRIE